MTKIFWSGVVVFTITVAVLVTDIHLEIWRTSLWIDVVEHSLGGVLAGLIGMWWALAIVRRATVIHALLGALILGIAVELLEYSFGWGISGHMNQNIDTMKDIIVDLVGGYISWLGWRRCI